ncbi:MAG TPA: alpha/beta fold hydrolase [Legionellaceae bacterium]|nr:alpha/beta fold hydrolase [Legionellaceae bacterium]
MLNPLAMQVFGSGPPLVFLHGWGFDAGIWKPWMPELQRLLPNHQMILVDLPGFGDSALLDWASFKTALWSVLPNKFGVVGWSLGGLYGTRLAIEHPDRISHVFNMTTSPHFMQASNWTGISAPILDDFYHRLQVDPLKTQRQFVEAQLSHHLTDIALSPSTMLGLKEGLDILKLWDLRDSLSRLKMPVAFVFGRLDTIVPRTLLPIMKKYYPEFQYTLLPHAAHIPFLSHPEICAQLLRDFLC